MLAHELGHVRNRDILISSVAATLAGAITLLARMGYWASLFGGMEATATIVIVGAASLPC